MEIIQELYLRQFEFDMEKAKQNLKEAVDKFNAAIDSGLKFGFADFGARRRHSFAWQDYAVGYMAKNCKCFVGTSNLYFAIKYVPIPKLILIRPLKCCAILIALSTSRESDQHPVFVVGSMPSAL